MSEDILDGTQETGITESMKASISGTAPWMKFMGVLFMIAGAIYVIVAIIAILASPLVGLITLAFCGLYIYLGYLIFRAGSDYSSYLASNSTHILEAAFANQKTWWKIMGILTIVGIVLGIAAGIFGASVGSQMANDPESMQQLIDQMNNR